METRELTWAQISDAALRVCTQRQIDVLRLWVAGMGTQRIGLALDISGSTAREHLRRALQKTKLELEREDCGCRKLDVSEVEKVEPGT